MITDIHACKVTFLKMRNIFLSLCLQAEIQCIGTLPTSAIISVSTSEKSYNSTCIADELSFNGDLESGSPITCNITLTCSFPTGLLYSGYLQLSNSAGFVILDGIEFSTFDLYAVSK